MKMNKWNKKLKIKFMLYSLMVVLMSLSVNTCYGANDPIVVVNNLSNFIFSLIRAIGMILLGFGVVQVGLSLKSHDPSQRANVRLVGALSK